jgi:hypothetical protein
MTSITEWHYGKYTLSTERSRLDVSLIHDYLSNTSYWANGRTVEVVQRSIPDELSGAVSSLLWINLMNHSLCFPAMAVCLPINS